MPAVSFQPAKLYFVHRRLISAVSHDFSKQDIKKMKKKRDRPKHKRNIMASSGVRKKKGVSLFLFLSVGIAAV